MEQIDTKKKYKLKRFINQLKAVRGRHTELVTVYIPKDYSLIKVIQQLAQEKDTASNIKDKRTRTNVQDSLERLIRHLRLYKETPPNGMAAFAGNISENESKVDIEVFSMEPPFPLTTRLYRCDQIFVLDELENQMESNSIHGLVVMDKREATIGLLKGSYIEKLHNLTSGVPGKYKTGGQSAARFSRLREQAAREFYQRIAEVVNHEFLNKKELKGIIIGGPGPTKNEFFEEPYINNEVKKKVIGLKDITYTDEFGLEELVEKSKDLLAQENVTVEKEVLHKFLSRLATDPKRAAYGLSDVEKALDYGAVETLLILEGKIDDKKAEELEERAANSGAQTDIVTDETQEGKQFKSLGGIGAMLRFPVH
ncbi:MAG: peptide chain release factor aRF-1 [Nanoarchaeota archaeon]